FQRWKIDRTNLARMGRDRSVQASREKELESIRSKAALDLGPQPLIVAKAPAPQNAAVPAQSQQSAAAPTPRRSMDFGFGSGGGGGGGGGPVGPLFVIFAALLARRQRKH
ncbi:MAG: hypothetical protein ACO1QR_16830, partial [Chthoniobacteraceae bacterium]